MEAATLPKKKTVSKGKVKKTLKNILCRPDPLFWPTVSDEHTKILEAVLSKHKVELPEFKKPLWKEIKSLPKDQRPRPPKLKRVDGLLFGITDCTKAVQNNECSSVIIESTVNPQAIVQPLIEACISSKIPVICLTGLKKISSENFGISTSSLAVKCNLLPELSSKIKEFAAFFKPPQPIVTQKDSADNKMEIDHNQNTEKKVSKATSVSCLYLYRTNKSARVFNPSLQAPKPNKAFVGQDFIEFSDKPEEKSHGANAYMGMIVKRITNNPKRVKRK